MLSNDFEGYARSKKTGNPVGIVITDDKKECYLVQDLTTGKRYQLYKDDIDCISDKLESF